MKLEEIKNIMTSMINKSFISLKNRKIILKEFNNRYYLGSAFRFIFLDWIFINREIINDKKRIIGILSHELSHLERYHKKNFFEYAFDGILYWINPKIREKDDKDTDRLAIRKGYGKELVYTRLKSLKDVKRKSISKYYLSPKEIKSYAKKIKRW